MKNTKRDALLKNKQAEEKALIDQMIFIYCRSKHGTKDFLCEQCRELKDYAHKRIDACPFVEEKTFCSSCKVHCYQQSMRERVREVMRFSGPRLLFIRPGVVFRHMANSLADKKSRSKRAKR